MTVSLIAAGPAHFAALLDGTLPEGAERLTASEIAPREVLVMLSALSERIAAVFTPNAWLIVEDGCIAGLIALVAEPEGRAVRIGYGVADDRRGRGLASGAVRSLLTIMQTDPRVEEVLAETSPGNPASQNVLRAAGFTQTGWRVDPEDGEVQCWRAGAEDQLG